MKLQRLNVACVCSPDFASGSSQSSVEDAFLAVWVKACVQCKHVEVPPLLQKSHFAATNLVSELTSSDF